MNIAILGYGQQGRSTYQYCNKPGNRITICDQDTSLRLPAGVGKQLGKDYLVGLERFDIIFRTPTVHPQAIVAANSKAILDKVTTNTNEFMKVCPTKNIIGVTGTKGKGTTSTLIAKMLEATGKHVHLGGNIGTPPLDLLKAGVKPDDWVVLELANFQLIDLKHSPPIAVCLMVVPEHLDWHADMHEYVTAKQQLFRWQTKDGTAIYFAESDFSKRIASISPGRHLPFYQPPGAYVKDEHITIDHQLICPVQELKLLGKHNWQNACAAITAVWQITQDTEAIRGVLISFSGLEHRLELVREIGGVRYYNDSFGTTPETAIVAIEAFEEPKIVILGGSSKGASYEQLAKTVAKNNVKNVITIGETGPAIANALFEQGYTNIIEGARSMPEIVQQAHQFAHAGDVVLLSTACASFDMFKNYKHRGEEFKKAVLALV